LAGIKNEDFIEDLRGTESLILPLLTIIIKEAWELRTGHIRIPAGIK
jgi:hypothetical protein